VGYGCTTCIGNSGRSTANRGVVAGNDLITASVLSAPQLRGAHPAEHQ
jgi:aconitase A